MWIEITTFKQIVLIKNVKRTKGALIFVITSLYCSWVYCEVVGDFYVFQLALAVYAVLLIFSLLKGAAAMIRTLSHGLPVPVRENETQRQRSKRAEIRRITNTACIFCFLFSMGIVSQACNIAALYLDYRLESVRCFVQTLFKVCILGCQVVLFFHLHDERLSSLENWLANTPLGRQILSPKQYAGGKQDFFPKKSEGKVLHALRNISNRISPIEST